MLHRSVQDARSTAPAAVVASLPGAYPLVRLREDHRRANGNAALHISPVSFGNLVEYCQWQAFHAVVAVEGAAEKGEKG